MSEQAPAGWYPEGQTNERYWDGVRWTSDIRPSDASPPPTDMQPQKEGPFGRVGSLIRKAAADRQAERRELGRKQEEDARAAGALVTSGVFGTSAVEIYVGGYVRVAEGRRETSQAARITAKTPFEKLRSIQFSGSKPDPQQSAVETSAIMKGASTLIKGGGSALKGSVPGLAMQGLSHVAKAKLGKSVLTVVTDKTIHTITNEMHNGVMTVAKADHNAVGLALDEAGNSVLEALGVEPQRAPHGSPRVDSPQPDTVVPQSVEPSVGDRLRELAALHRDGVLSDDEFSSAKAKLLGL